MEVNLFLGRYFLAVFRLAPPFLLCLLALSGCQGEEPFPSAAELASIKALTPGVRSPLGDPTNRLLQLPADQLARAISLGTRLFEEKALSGCGTIACSSCHVAPTYTFPETATAPGCGGQTARNVPSLLNVGRYEWFTWDMSRDTLWSQAIAPLLNPLEMASSGERVRDVLDGPPYRDAYQALFAARPSEEPVDRVLSNVGKLLASYERTLVQIDSPFDAQVADFVEKAEAGDVSTHPLYLGLKTFVRRGGEQGCIVCHKGAMLTDGSFHNIGVPDASSGREGRAAALSGLLSDRFNAVGPYSDATTGVSRSRLENLRAAAAPGEQHEAMVGAFKTPSLRNIGWTGPYMHTGELRTLEEVVDFYDRGGGDEGTFAGKKTVTLTPLRLEARERQALVDLLKRMAPAR